MIQGLIAALGSLIGKGATSLGQGVVGQGAGAGARSLFADKGLGEMVAGLPQTGGQGPQAAPLDPKMAGLSVMEGIGKRSTPGKSEGRGAQYMHAAATPPPIPQPGMGLPWQDLFGQPRQQWQPPQFMNMGMGPLFGGGR